MTNDKVISRLDMMIFISLKLGYGFSYHGIPLYSAVCMALEKDGIFCADNSNNHKSFVLSNSDHIKKELEKIKIKKPEHHIKWEDESLIIKESPSKSKAKQDKKKAKHLASKKRRENSRLAQKSLQQL